MYVGIDPGKTGAIAVQYDDGSIEVFDVPTFERPAGKTTKLIAAAPEMYALLSELFLKIERELTLSPITYEYQDGMAPVTANQFYKIRELQERVNGNANNQ